jgi:hypothetical protein
MKSAPSRYRGHRFPPEIIGYAVWVYLLAFVLCRDAGIERSPHFDAAAEAPCPELRRPVELKLCKVFFG